LSKVISFFSKAAPRMEKAARVLEEEEENRSLILKLFASSEIPIFFNIFTSFYNRLAFKILLTFTYS